MAICGFNEKIGNGLRLLSEGMIDALETKAVRSTPEKVLARELVELENIISVLRTSEGEVLPEMFIGLNLFAKALFVRAQQDLTSLRGESLETVCREISENFIDLLSQTERRSEQMPLREDGSEAVAKRARELAQWALDQSRCDVAVSREQ